MKKLSIILPFYGEDIETIQPMLSSINNQEACTPSDYELILVDDCGPSNITMEDVKKYLWKFDARIIKMEKNGGPGNARQFGIDNSKAEYVTMGDCDDVLYSNYVFNFFEQVLYKEQPDTAHTRWFSCHYVPNMNYMMQPMGPEATWFFGKFYKRSFLEKNNLRMHPELRVHEEIQIVRLAPQLTKNFKFYDFPTYVWSTSEGSITRKNDGEYAYTGNATYIKSNDILLDRMISVNKDEALKQAWAVILLMWTSFQNIDYDNGQAKDWKDQTEKAISYFINKWGDKIFELASQNPQFTQIQLEEYKGINAQLQKFPKETFDNWYERMKKLEITEFPDYKQPDTTTVKKGK